MRPMTPVLRSHTQLALVSPVLLFERSGLFLCTTDFGLETAIEGVGQP